MPTKITIRITKAKESEKHAIIEAGKRLQVVINHREFEQRVLVHEYDGKSGFADNVIAGRQFTNAQVLAILLAGREELDPVLDHEWDMELSVYTRKRSTVGSTSPGITTVYMNRRALRFEEAGWGEIAGNMAHEHCHKLGFDHDFESTPKRPFSVPYAIGDMVEKVYASLFRS